VLRSLDSCPCDSQPSCDVLSVKLHRLPSSIARIWPAASAAGAGDAAEKPAKDDNLLLKPVKYLSELLHPFSDPAANGKLLALSFAGLLSSVATLIHDTYLAVYLQDVLGLSNTKVGPYPGGALLSAFFIDSAVCLRLVCLSACVWAHSPSGPSIPPPRHSMQMPD
jgi:hypothetical protein